MPAPKGNKFWEARSSHGSSPKIKTPKILWELACEYFQWIEDNPLYESKAFSTQSGIVQEPVTKMRAMTFDGLQVFIGISDQTWRNYREKEDFFGVVSRIESVIRDQKFAGAAAGLLNSNIIARDLGLKDASTSEHTGPNGGPIQTTQMNFIPVDEND